MRSFPALGVGGTLGVVAELGLVLKVLVHQGNGQLAADKLALPGHGDGLAQGTGQAVQTRRGAGMGQLWPALVVPASAFVVGTLVRKLIDRPRPYTALGFTPLFPKDKTGQSMPSRHCFSAAAIAGTAWYVLPPLGAVLAVLGVLIAISRVVTGVHYISDVLAGLAFGSVFAVLGWNAFVLAASALGFYAIMLL